MDLFIREKTPYLLHSYSFFPFKLTVELYSSLSLCCRGCASLAAGGLRQVVVQNKVTRIVVAAIARQGARRFLDAHGMPEGYFNSFFSSEAGPATRIFYISLLGWALHMRQTERWNRVSFL